MSNSSISTELLNRFAAIVGDRYALRSEADLAPHLIENRGLYHGSSPLLLKPGSVEKVSDIMAGVDINHVPYKGGGPAMENLPEAYLWMHHFRTPRRSPSGNPAGFGFDNHQRTQSFLNRNF